MLVGILIMKKPFKKGMWVKWKDAINWQPAKIESCELSCITSKQFFYTVTVKLNQGYLSADSSNFERTKPTNKVFKQMAKDATA
jgi:hypothetical protein